MRGWTKGEDWYFVVPTIIVWASGLLVTGWDFILVQRMNYRFNLASLVGLGVFFIGVLIWFKAKGDLGRYYSPGLKIVGGQVLVKDGIYKYLRHPIYLGNLLVWAPAPLLVSSLWGFATMLFLIPCYLYRMKIEEDMLLEQFGEEYREYAKTTKRLIPYIY